MVFWRDTGGNEEDEEVEARDVLDAGCNIVATDMAAAFPISFGRGL
jgi:hypothetical protein